MKRQSCSIDMRNGLRPLRACACHHFDDKHSAVDSVSPG